jgi:hypothetical protein
MSDRYIRRIRSISDHLSTNDNLKNKGNEKLLSMTLSMEGEVTSSVKNQDDVELTVRSKLGYGVAI